MKIEGETIAWQEQLEWSPIKRIVFSKITKQNR
jgi:DNA topoisomerase IA